MEPRPAEFTEEEWDEANQEQMLGELLLAGKLFAHGPKRANGPRTVLSVLCNDLFYWASADAEEIPVDEIGNLYRMWLFDKKWGTSKWCCKQRKLKPQVPIVEAMKKEGAWDPWMDNLKTPRPS